MRIVRDSLKLDAGVEVVHAVVQNRNQFFHRKSVCTMWSTNVQKSFLERAQKHAHFTDF